MQRQTLLEYNHLLADPVSWCEQVILTVLIWSLSVATLGDVALQGSAFPYRARERQRSILASNGVRSHFE